MILGMSLQAFTLLHVLISLAGIASGFVVIYGFLTNKLLNGWTAFFLITTALTSITGFLFPFKEVTPGIVVGVLSVIVLAIAIAGRYRARMGRKTWVVTASLAQYFNVFVLVAQSFQKIPALHALAPTQKEPPFGLAQLTVLVLFIVLTVLAIRKFHPAPLALKAAEATN